MVPAQLLPLAGGEIMISEQLSLKVKIKAERVWLMIVSRLIIIALMFVSCRTDHLPLEPELTLSVADVSCTEVWLKAEGIGGNEFILERDGSEIENYSVISGNIIYDDSLRPNTTYAYRLTRLSGAERSREVTATTLDTTSHNYIWQTFTFGGEAGSCVLYDCAILSKDDIWCAGAIYLKDSLGNPDPDAYNAIHWDGQQWELKRIQFRYFCNQPDTFPAPANSILALNSNDVFISAGSQIAHWNGQHQDGWECIPVSAKRLWGTNKNDIYAVGALGKIAHSNGSSWQKIESGTEYNINDIWGSENAQGSLQIIAVAGNLLHGYQSERAILNISGNKAAIINSTGTGWPLSSVWFKTNSKYYVAGSGIFENNTSPEGGWKSLGITDYMIYKIRGDGLNNIAACGGLGEIIHFNGISWKSFVAETQLPSGNYYGISIKEDLIVAAGFNGASAVITVGNK
jgi:hypothetical protein